MAQAILDPAVVEGFGGELLSDGDPGYDDARSVFNAGIDRRPAVIARCTGVADVIDALALAREHGLEVSVKGGGHAVAGHAVVDGGLTIDLRPMNRVRVDPERRTAWCGGGTKWGELDRETQAFGLAVTGGRLADTGVGGLTLGGGSGWIDRKYGLTVDSLISAEVVTADGRHAVASADRNPDLFWALKGGGGNFGVVTSITYQLHPVSEVISGMLLHPLARAREVLRFYRDFVAAGLPDELIVYAAVMTGPDGTPLVAIIPAYTGANLDEGERLLAPLRAFGPPVADMVQRMPYVAMQTMIDIACPYGVLRSYWKSNFLSALPDDAIDVFARYAEQCPSPRTFAILEHSHGAPARVAAHTTAFPTRQHAFDLVILSLWEDANADAAQTRWTRAFYEAMQPWSASLVYVNALSEDDGARVVEAYGSNYRRLAEVKAKYDPENRFRRNQNVLPARSIAEPTLRRSAEQEMRTGGAPA